MDFIGSIITDPPVTSTSAVLPTASSLPWPDPRLRSAVPPGSAARAPAPPPSAHRLMMFPWPMRHPSLSCGRKRAELPGVPHRSNSARLLAASAPARPTTKELRNRLSAGHESPRWMSNQSLMRVLVSRLCWWQNQHPPPRSAAAHPRSRLPRRQLNRSQSPQPRMLPSTLPWKLILTLSRSPAWTKTQTVTKM